MNTKMKTIHMGDTGAAIRDVQQRLVTAGFLTEENISGTFDEVTAEAANTLARKSHLPENSEIDANLWAALVDASFMMGDRTLYLKMPYFHGHDVVQLQEVLGALGFNVPSPDGIFGAYTEAALRKFQINFGLPDDGIAGSFTYAAINNLKHSWEGKTRSAFPTPMSFARAASALETTPICLFGTEEFTRDVSARMSNLSLATNPASKILSAEDLLSQPTDDMLLVHIILGEDRSRVPRVVFAEETKLSQQLHNAILAARYIAKRSGMKPKIVVVLPSETWEEAGPERSAQHYAITLLDGLCEALAY